MSISLNNINKQFAQSQILQNINAEVQDGEFVALLGPSGCGKTTLLRIIAGLETATQGEILINGRNVTTLSPQQRGIGFVFQQYALFRHMTVFNNIAFGLRMKPRNQRLNKEAIRDCVENLLNRVQLADYANYYPDQLSGGQKQRVALARALATEPAVLLLDEPFAALDAKVRKELRRWLRGFHQQNAFTSIFVTHDQDEAMEVADKIIVMNQGQIEQIGSPEQVYRQPKTAFVTHFLGDINVLQGYITNNRLQLGQFQQDLSSQGKWPDQEAVAYIRPHEFKLSKTEMAQSIIGEVTRITLQGMVIIIGIKVEYNSQLVEAAISYGQYTQEQFVIGDKVYLQPRLVNVFMQDELIEYNI